MKVVATALVIAGISAGYRADLRAQAAEDLVARAVRAYGDVDLDATVGFLRRWFASEAATRAPLDQRRRALTYLGAAEGLRGNADSATSAFERLVELDPRARLDEFIFPPEVTTRFEAVRFRTKVVSVTVAAVTDLRPDLPFTARLLASSPHQIRAALRRPAGGPFRVIYAGLIGDSLSVRWDGRDSSGALVASGTYLLEIFSTPAGGDLQRVVQVPLDITALPGDTLPAPPALPDSLLLPVRRGAGPGLEALFGGIIAGVGLAVLPPVLAPDADVTAWRWAVAGSVSLAGLVGFLRHLPGGTVAANQQANEALRREWRERAAAAAEQNRSRRAEATSLVIRAGQPAVIRLNPR